MAASLSVVPLYMKSKLEVFVSEKSLLSRILDIPRSFVNMIITIPSILFSVDNTTWFLTRYWRYGWSLIMKKPVMKEKAENESEVVEQALCDCATQKVNAYTITSLYFDILDNKLNFFGVTSQSLELLRYESKVLQGLQDFELLTTLKSLFGCMPEDYSHFDRPAIEFETYPGVTELFWNASVITWRTFFSRLLNSPVISWILPFNKEKNTDKKSTTAAITPPLSTTNSVIENEASYHSSQHKTPPSVGSLLMCETSFLTTILSDSGTYALSTTHDLLKEAILLFVPMEMLENTTGLLNDPSLALSLSPVSAFWQLFNYVSIWGLDIMEEVCNQPEINYAVIDDDDFHFVVNVPKIRRPIMFIGIR